MLTVCSQLTRTLCLSICVSMPTVITTVTDSDQQTVNGQCIKGRGNSVRQDQRAYRKLVKSVLKVDMQFVPLNLRLNLHCGYLLLQVQRLRTVMERCLQRMKTQRRRRECSSL